MARIDPAPGGGSGGSSLASPTAGDAGKFVAVNDTEDGYELVAAPSGGGASVVPALFVVQHTGDNNAPRFAFDGSEADDIGVEVKTISSVVVNVAAGGTFWLSRWTTATPGLDATLGYCELIVESRSGTDRIIANPASGLVPSPSGEPLNPTDLPFTGSWDEVGTDLTIVDGRVQTAAGGDFLITVSMQVTVSDPT